MKKLINKKDVLFIGGVLLIAFAFFAWQHFSIGEPEEGSRIFAEITIHGQLVYIAYLDEGYDREFVLPEHPGVRFAIQDGRIAFESADCPDQVCILMGWQGVSGWAACLPNGILFIVHGAATDIDIISQCCTDPSLAVAVK
ncbi:MAG: NusG domain II-containing protein [Defluviitaleaceae bacterium]|nr:NusG domain II-containing protein [Defluviitaleaceae bacterium]